MYRLVSFLTVLIILPALSYGNESACEELSENITVLMPIQETISRDFVKVSDPYLCSSMVEQCEYFYSELKSKQKQYKNDCDQNFEIAKIEKCDYKANPCLKPLRKAKYGGLHQSAINEKPHEKNYEF